MAHSLTTRPATQRIIEMKFAHSELVQLRDNFSELQEHHALQRMREATGIEDMALLRRLRNAGFHTDNIHALTWLPIALVAWASQGVSDDEVRTARLVNLYAFASGSSDSMQLFNSWLSSKPSQALVELWEDYVRSQNGIFDESWRELTGKAVLDAAEKVARASGGFLGIGQISAAEQRVLTKIAEVYGLRS